MTDSYVYFENKRRKVYTRKDGTKYFMFKKRRKDVGSLRISRDTGPSRLNHCKPTEELHVNGKCYKKCRVGTIRSVTTNRCIKSPRRPSPRRPSPRRSPPQRSPSRQTHSPGLGDMVTPVSILPFNTSNQKILNHFNKRYYKTTVGIGKKLKTLNDIIYKNVWTIIQFSKSKENVTNMISKDVINNYKLINETVDVFYVYDKRDFILHHLNISEEQVKDKDNFSVIVHNIDRNPVRILDTDLERYIIKNLRRQRPRIFIPQPGTARRSPMHGNPVNSILAMLYLSRKYENITCMTGISRVINITVGQLKDHYYIDFTDFMITLLGSDIFIHFSVVKEINDCLVSNQRFIILPLTLRENPSGPGHAGLLIYDKNTKILERFEPHGYNTNVDARLFDNKIVETLENDTNIKINQYLKPIDFCPAVSFQTLEDGPSLPTDPGGFCQSWVFYYIELRMRNPNIDREDLIKTTIGYIQSNRLEFKKLIRGYSYMLRHINRIVESTSQEDVQISDVMKRISG